MKKSADFKFFGIRKVKNGDNASDFKKKTTFRKHYRHYFVFLQKNSKKMNYKTSILGRRHEQDLIREYYESPKPRFETQQIFRYSPEGGYIG